MATKLPSLAFLKDSTIQWKARHTYRQARLNLWVRRESYRYQKWHFYRYDSIRPEDERLRLRQKWYPLYARAEELVDKWIGLRDEASGALAGRREQIEEHASKLSPYFTIREFDCNDGTPVPKNSEAAVGKLCSDVLDKMRRKFGRCRVNSGYRHTTYNRGIGGATRSYHIYDLRKDEVAADITFAQGTPAEWASYARGLGVGGVGQYGTFVHVDNGPRRTWSG